MVSTLDSGSKGLSSSPGWVIVLCSWARHTTLTVPLSTHPRRPRGKIIGRDEDKMAVLVGVKF